MCGRYSLTTETSQLTELFELAAAPAGFAPRYNIAPSYNGTAPPVIIRATKEGSRELTFARWWLIPSWWKKPLDKLPTAFNARAEQVASKPFYRASFQRRRCLVPADGWYEFKGPAGKKESYYFHEKHRQAFAFAGLWDQWRSQEGELIDSFAIITTEPNDLAKPIHSRMPLVLAPEGYDDWLDPALTDPSRAQKLLRASKNRLFVYRASGAGNNPKHEGSDCIEPF